jgi:hypothetical protein
MDELLEKLTQAVDEIRACTDRAKLQTLWKQAFNLLKKAPLDQNRVANVIAGRNMDGLTKLVTELKPPPPQADVAAAVPDDVHLPATHDTEDEETLKSAMRLFRRRYKFAKLDEESRLGRGHLTKGDYNNFSIEPPLDYPRAIWDTLVKQGLLKRDGKGFYYPTSDS